MQVYRARRSRGCWKLGNRALVQLNKAKDMLGFSTTAPDCVLQLYKGKEIVGLPAARYSGKQGGGSEGELANHPILLRKSRLWDCIPGRLASVDDGMSGALP